MEAALTSAYGRLGIRVEFVDMPGERAIVESSAGHVDGETARIAGMVTRYPALVAWMCRCRLPLFHYLNQKHEALLPAISHELIKLKGAKDAVVAAKVSFP